MQIASRSLKYTSSNGDLDIPVRIFAPAKADNGAWSCQYEIDWPDGKWTMAAWGTDSIQAILLAMQMIGSEIYTSNYHKSGNLFLDAPGKGYWFPVPTGLRGLLEGDARNICDARRGRWQSRLASCDGIAFTLKKDRCSGQARP